MLEESKFDPNILSQIEIKEEKNLPTTTTAIHYRRG